MGQISIVQVRRARSWVPGPSPSIIPHSLASVGACVCVSITALALHSPPALRQVLPLCSLLNSAPCPCPWCVETTTACSFVVCSTCIAIGSDSMHSVSHCLTQSHLAVLINRPFQSKTAPSLSFSKPWPAFPAPVACTPSRWTCRHTPQRRSVGCQGF